MPTLLEQSHVTMRESDRKLHATSPRAAPIVQRSEGPADIRLRSLARQNVIASVLLCSVIGTLARADEMSKGAVLARGQHIAELICSACHVVARTQEFPPMLSPPAPSFDEIANRSGVTLQTVRQFVSRTHWDLQTLPMQMPNPMLSTSDATAVAGYVLSLRRP